MNHVVADRVRKLLRLAESAPLEEASAARGVADALMVKHGIHVDATERAVDVEGVYGVLWAERLLSAAARARGCRMRKNRRTEIARVLGDYAESAVELYRYWRMELLVRCQCDLAEYRIESESGDNYWYVSRFRGIPEATPTSAWYRAYLNTAVDDLFERIDPVKVRKPAMSYEPPTVSVQKVKSDSQLEQDDKRAEKERLAEDVKEMERVSGLDMVKRFLYRAGLCAKEASRGLRPWREVKLLSASSSFLPPPPVPPPPGRFTYLDLD
jgi:Protein of unknown function (DUF2786)